MSSTALQLTVTLFMTAGTYRYATFFDARNPLFLPTLNSVTMTQRLPTDDQPLGQEIASIDISTIDKSSTEAPTLASIFAAENPLGKPCHVVAYDLDASTTPWTLYGVVSSLASDFSQFSVQELHPELEKGVLPKVLTADIFDNVDFSTAGAGADRHCPVVVHRKATQVPLPMLHAKFLEVTAVLAGAEANKFIYSSIDGLIGVTILSGDTLVYGLTWGATRQDIALDLRFTDATFLRSTAAVDQNGLSAAPSTDLSTYAIGKDYTRSIPLTLVVGKTISHYLIGAERDIVDTYTAYLLFAYIVDASGAIKAVIFDETTTALSLTLLTESNAGCSLSASLFDRWDFGPIRPAATGAVSVDAVYLDEFVALSAGYTLTNWNGYHVVRFSQPPINAQGGRARVKVDLSSTEFATFADVIKFWLSNATYGFGWTVDAAVFTAIAGNMVTLGYSGPVGAVDQQTPAIEIFKHLLVHRVRLGRNVSNEHTMLGIGLSPPADSGLRLGQEDATNLRNFTLTEDTRATLDFDSRLKKLILLGYYDRGLREPSWLISSERSRAVEGRTLTLENPYLGSGASVDIEADFRYKEAIANDDKITGEAGNEARALTLQQRVTVTAPAYAAVEFVTYGMILVSGGGRQTITLELVKYSAALYTYTPGKVKVAPRVLFPTDYSGTEPGIALNLLTPTYTFDLDSQGNQITVARLTADAPAVNVNALLFRAKRRIAGSPTLITFREVAVPCTPGQTLRKAELDLAAGVEYDIEVQTYNSGNQAAFQYGPVATFLGSPITTPKDTVGPGAPTSLSAKTKAGISSVTLQATMPSALDVEIVRLYRSIDTVFANAIQVNYAYASSLEVVTIIDDDVAFNTPVSYWMRCQDFSKNAGTLSARLDVAAIAASRIAYTIDPKRDTLFHYDFNAKSTQGRGPRAGFVATIRGIEGKFGGAIAIEDATTNVLANGDFATGTTASWTVVAAAGGGSAITVEASDHPDFEYHARIFDNDITDDSQLRQDEVYTSGQVADGEIFYVSCYARALDIELGTMQLLFQMYDDLPVIIASAAVNITSTEWARYELTLTVPTTPGVRFLETVRAWINCTAGNTGTVVVTGIQVERAGFTTSYTNGARAAGALNYPSTMLPVAVGTLGCWVYIRTGAPHSAADGQASLFTIRNAAAATVNSLLVHKVASSLDWLVQFRDEAAAFTNFSLSSSYMTPGWHMVVVTWKQSTTYAEVFVDGVSRGSSSSATLPKTFALSANSDTLNVGKTVAGASYLNSLVDELFVLPRLMTAAEAKRIYEQDAPFYDPESVERGNEIGPPANAFVTASFTMTNTALTTGGRRHIPHWVYTMPALGSESLRPDGFRIYFESGNISNPALIDVGHGDIGPDVRDFIKDFGHVAGGVYSWAISAYRKTRRGIEETPRVMGSAWQNVSIDNQIGGGGLGPGIVDTVHIVNLAVTTGKIADLAVTNAKISGLLTINPSGVAGATALLVTNSGAIRLQAMTGTPSRLVFEDASAVEQASLGGSSGNLSLQPVSNHNNVLNIGGSSFFWSDVWVRGDNIRLPASYIFLNPNSVGGGSGGLLEIGTDQIKLTGAALKTAAAGGTYAAFKIEVRGAAGTVIGYIPLTTT